MSTVTNSMENTPPARIVSKYNSDSDRLHWNLLPTLSQPTRHTIDSNKNIKTSKSPSKKNNTLMDSTRENTQVGGEDSKWKDRSSLLTPPNSQDATSMLISPPPEEILRIEFNSRHSVSIYVHKMIFSYSDISRRITGRCLPVGRKQYFHPTCRPPLFLPILHLLSTRNANDPVL